MIRLSTLLGLALALLLSSCATPTWTTSKEGALIYNEYPKPDETVSWTGGKDSEGYAHGEGTATWKYSNSRYEIWRGRIEHGKHTPTMKLVSSGYETTPPARAAVSTPTPIPKERTYSAPRRVSSSVSQRCTGITRKGTRCKNSVIGGTRCHYHD